MQTEPYNWVVGTGKVVMHRVLEINDTGRTRWKPGEYEAVLSHPHHGAHINIIDMVKEGERAKFLDPNHHNIIESENL